MRKAKSRGTRRTANQTVLNRPYHNKPRKIINNKTHENTGSGAAIGDNILFLNNEEEEMMQNDAKKLLGKILTCNSEVTKCKCACFCFDSCLVHCDNNGERAELFLFKL